MVIVPITVFTESRTLRLVISDMNLLSNQTFFRLNICINLMVNYTVPVIVCIIATNVLSVINAVMRST